jgi:hydroxymethylbilane synthase
MGGCSTPISGLAIVENETVTFHGNILAPDGSEKAEVVKRALLKDASDLGREAALELLSSGGSMLADKIRDAAHQ